MSIAVGDSVPDFSVTDDAGTIFTRQSLLGKRTVLYFYPKDDTPGCTKEACGFNDALTQLIKAGVQILGVSKDKITDHVKFKNKYSLQFPLLADTDKQLCNAFGVLIEKSRYGRKYMGIERSTFLINAKGIIEKVWRDVKVDGHVDEILAETGA